MGPVDNREVFYHCRVLVGLCQNLDEPSWPNADVPARDVLFSESNTVLFPYPFGNTCDMIAKHTINVEANSYPPQTAVDSAGAF